MSIRVSFKSLIFGLAAVAVLAACGKKEAPPQSPPEAAYYTVKQETLPLETELPGRLESYRTADVRARVPGVLIKRYFEEGSIVKEGQILFKVDPRNYEAAVNRAKASLAKARANQVQADLKLKRYGPLVKINAVSKQEYDEVLALSKQAAADVNSAQAALVSAKLDLEYAIVRAPITGRIGRAIVTEGGLVGQDGPTLLAKIQQINPMYLNLTQSSADMLRIRKQMTEGALKGTDVSSLPVKLILEDGTEFAHTGKLMFSDISVDPSSGEVSVRALFKNPEGILLPGMFVRAKFDQVVMDNAITVPQQGVTITNDGRTLVYVIDADGKVKSKPVKIGRAVKTNHWLVTEGLEPGDRVIVEGLQKVRPGSPVTPVEWVDPLAPKAPAPDMPADTVNQPAAAQEGQTAQPQTQGQQAAAPAQAQPQQAQPAAQTNGQAAKQ